MEFVAGFVLYAVVALVCLRFFIHVRACDKHMRQLLADNEPMEQELTNTFSS